MTIFEIVILLSALCGILMVLGSLYLLYTGAITLKQASETQALNVEIAKNVKLSTRYPALGLFAFGLLFILAAIFSAKPPPAPTYEVTGQLLPLNAKGLHDVSIQLCAGPWVIPPATNGEIYSIFTIAPKQFQVQVQATGFEDGRKTLNPQIKGTSILIGDIDLGEAINILPDRIRAAPPLAPNPPEVQFGSRSNPSTGSY